MPYLPDTNEILKVIDEVIAGSYCHDEYVEALSKELRNLSDYAHVNSEWMIRSERPVISKLIVLVKRTIRKFIRWYANPIIEQQNNVNASVNRIANTLMHYIKDTNRICTEQNNVLIKLVDEIGNLTTDVQRLRAQLNEMGNLTTDVQRLRAQLDEMGNLTTDVQQLRVQLDEMGDLTTDVQQLRVQLDEMGNLTTDVQQLRTQLDEMDNLTTDVQQLRAQLDEMDSLKHEMHVVKNHITDNDNLILQEQIELKAAKLHREKMLEVIQEQTARSTFYDARMKRLERKLKEIGVYSVETEKVLNDDKGVLALNNGFCELDFDYFLFESKYRGTIEDIKNRQRVYVDIFKNRDNVLDIGCGRGEFVELLLDNHINVKGIDISDDCVAYCVDNNLPVIKADLFVYLSEAADESLDGIFCSQVIEHLTPEQLINFVNLIYCKLKTNAPIVLETINPKNIVAVSNWFYMDITHIRPVHPETLSFIMDTHGFRNKEILYLHSNDAQKLPPLEGKGTELFNMKLQELNEILFGAQDYALISYKIGIV